MLCKLDSWRDWWTTVQMKTVVSSNQSRAKILRDNHRIVSGCVRMQTMLRLLTRWICGNFCTPSGWFYRWFASMQEAYRRTCSHFSTRSTLGIPEGTLLRTVLTGDWQIEQRSTVGVLRIRGTFPAPAHPRTISNCPVLA